MDSQITPKTSRNRGPKNSQFAKAFSSKSCKIKNVETLKISIFPKENHYF